MEFVALRDAHGLTDFDIRRMAALHRALAPSDHAYDIIHTHCEIVARLALSVARACDLTVNERLLAIGGLVHDIGTYQLIKNDGSDGGQLTFKNKYIQHGIRGYKLLKACKYGEDVAEFARNHTGIGLTASMVRDQQLPLPVDDYVPVTTEQDLVMYADKFHTKSDPAEFVDYDRCIRRAAKHGADNARNMGLLIEKYGMPPLGDAAREYGMVLR